MKSKRERQRERERRERSSNKKRDAVRQKAAAIDSKLLFVMLIKGVENLRQRQIDKEREREKDREKAEDLQRQIRPTLESIFQLSCHVLA